MQKQERRTLIQRADAVSRQCKGEVLKCVRELRKELLLQLEEHDLSRNADMRDRLIAETQHVELCKKIKAYDMRRADLIFFLIGVVCLVSKGEDLCTSVRMA